MRKLFRLLSLLLAALAVVSMAILVAGDTRHAFAPSLFHGKAGAVALGFASAAYIAAQVRRQVSADERLRAVLLGAAFVFWGAEQFLEPSRLLTLLDSAVIGIFVVDLCLITLAIHRDRRSK